MKPILTGLQFIAAAGFLASGVLFADGPGFGSACNGLPGYGALKAALKSVAPGGSNSVNGGLNDNMWATVVNRDGIVCAVVFTGRRSRVPMAREPRDFGAEGQYGERLQPAGIGFVYGQSLGPHATRR